MPRTALFAADPDAAVEQLYAAHWRQLVRLATMLVPDDRRITIVD